MRELWLFLLIVVLVLFGLDYFVYRHWRHFARAHRKIRWTLIPYRVLLGLMPFTMPLYFIYSRWWEVEPKAARLLFVGFWMVYYLPKIVIGVFLVFEKIIRVPVRRFLKIRARSSRRESSVSTAKQITRSEFLQQVGWTAAAVPFVIVGYSVYRTLYHFSVRHIDIKIGTLPRQLDGLSIAQISDIHAGSLFDSGPIEEAAAIIQQARPDLIAVTGDLVNHDAGEIEIIQPILRDLQPDLDVYVCLGNHEHYARIDDVVRGISETPATLLVNEHRSLSIDGARLHIIGTDNTGFNQHYGDLETAVESLVTETGGEDIRILLAHDPSFWDSHVRPYYPEIDIMLAGHTHGGQIGLEWGPLRWSLAQSIYPRWAGLYTEPGRDGQSNQHLYVNRGMGTVGPPIRIGIRPEITIITLRRS